MDKSYQLNDYVEALETNQNEYENSQSILEQFHVRTDGSRSIEELKKETNTFLANNDLPANLQEEIQNALDSFQENTTLSQASMTLENILKYYDMAKEIKMNYPSDTTLLNNTLVEAEKKVSNQHAVTFQEDGTIQIDASKTSPEAMNFIAMMVLALVIGNGQLSLETNMDMKFIKEEREENQFQVIFGNFPLVSTGNRLDPGIIASLQELMNSYQPNVSYKVMLASLSPEIKMALDIVEDQVFDRPGAFKMAIKTNGQQHDMKFGMDQNYQDIIEAFSEIGATAIEDLNHNLTFLLPANQDQLVILSHVSESLRQKGYSEQEAQQLVNQFQKRLVIDHNGNIHSTLLTVIMITELALVSFFLYLFIH